MKIYLLSGLPPTRTGLGLETQYTIEESKRLVHGKSYVCIVVKAKHVGSVIDWQTTDVLHVCL